jgi:hypothetical protein
MIFTKYIYFIGEVLFTLDVNILFLKTILFWYVTTLLHFLLLCRALEEAITSFSPTSGS